MSFVSGVAKIVTFFWKIVSNSQKSEIHAFLSILVYTHNIIVFFSVVVVYINTIALRNCYLVLAAVMLLTQQHRKGTFKMYGSQGQNPHDQNQNHTTFECSAPST